VEFQGFSSKGLRFLREVRQRNSKPWFEESRSVYTDRLLAPFQQLVAVLSGTMLSIDPIFEVRPAINKTISRIYRDTRFSKDKSLYRDTMWLTFKRPVKDRQDRPGFFFELTPKTYRYGMGFYQARRSTMDAFRQAIDRNPGKFLSSTLFYRKHNCFELHGEKYKRPLGSDHTDAIQDWYQRKSWYLACNRKIDDIVQSPDLVNELRKGFVMLKSLYLFVPGGHQA